MAGTDHDFRRFDRIQHVPTRRVGRFIRDTGFGIAKVRYPNSATGQVEDWPLKECIKMTPLTPAPSVQLVRFDDASIERDRDGLPVDLTQNLTTGEKAQAVGRRTWRRGQRPVPMVDVRIDTGSSYIFTTWTANNCRVLVGERVLAAR